MNKLWITKTQLGSGDVRIYAFILYKMISTTLCITNELGSTKN